MSKLDSKSPTLKRISDIIWEVSPSFKEGMLVPARIYGTEKIIKTIDKEVFDQITNVATLRGIKKYAFALPDCHSGYGFPIGGVAAFDVDEGGVISPGGTGFDINCGMRLILTDITKEEIKPKIKELIDALFKAVPSGVGSSGALNLTKNEFKELAVDGAEWAVKKEGGDTKDLKATEMYGVADWADVTKISEKAISRGIKQIGTLGSGNHYLEIQYITESNIFDKKIAKKWGIFDGQVAIMFHCGSRGAGHQIATDYLLKFLDVMERKYAIKLRDKELASAPFYSEEGQDYYKAMGCGVNISFANRQIIFNSVRHVFSSIFKKDADKLGIRQLFDIAHNRPSLEEYEIDGLRRKLLVHRKGATASYYKGRKEIPVQFRKDGSPVIIGGSMETGSYLLIGKEGAKETFCSTAHGSGRTMSRTAAKKAFSGEDIIKSMLSNGIYEKSASMAGIAEEAGLAYKDIDEVALSVETANISSRVAKLLPIGGIKG